METVPDLVDGLLFLPCKPALVVQRILFEEKANLVARSEEVIVPDVIVVARCELRFWMRIDVEFVKKLFRPLQETICYLLRQEPSNA